MIDLASLFRTSIETHLFCFKLQLSLMSQIYLEISGKSQRTVSSLTHVSCRTMKNTFWCIKVAFLMMISDLKLVSLLLKWYDWLVLAKELFLILSQFFVPEMVRKQLSGMNTMPERSNYPNWKIGYFSLVQNFAFNCEAKWLYQGMALSGIS